MEKINHIQLVFKESVRDGSAERVASESKKYLGIETGRIKTGKIYSILYDLSAEQMTIFANRGLRDSIVHDVYVNSFYQSNAYASYILVSKLPGVTDDEGISAQKTLCDIFNLPFTTSGQFIFTQEIYYFENELDSLTLKRISEELLGNDLIHHFEYGIFDGRIHYIPTVHLTSHTSTEYIDIFVSDEALADLSRKMLLSLDLEEMKAIQNYYRDARIVEERNKTGMSNWPTDCELEIFAQTWSEHCKHKEFNAEILFIDHDLGTQKTIHSLFKTYIVGATQYIENRLKTNHQHWLLKVFSDNAGVVRIDDDRVFIWKVETHNTPSALDPYGGALTGIVGVNRDPLGTGIGGGKLLFNTNVLCFGSPYYEGRLLKRQLHPRRIMTGVIKGIEDGGNKSGIPTVNGSIIFDRRYSGKPLVYCGTGAVMPAMYQGRKSWEKHIDAGDRIVMVGGRVGKDGIHGATFSSAEIDEHSPRSAVQIGSPITQKNLSDFFEKACEQGLVKCSTDNGAGGLSSSVGEMARLSHGAIVQLEKVPLKYSGLKPWEIFLSESQERMNLAVEPRHLETIQALAIHFEVELSDIGVFTSDGYLDVRYDDERVAHLNLDFLHNGVPAKKMVAEWKKPRCEEPSLPRSLNYAELLLKLLGSVNICSREEVIRRYDHEVKGKTMIKPLMGRTGEAPQDAAVLRLDFNSYEGIAISNGIAPRYGDIDAYHMSAGAFDEAIRQIISVGGKLPDPAHPDNRFWSVNDNFCMPDSAYHEQHNPDGKYKLAQLVRMCEALYDVSTYFLIPMTSGKDSMKNDFLGEGVKISVPPTILYSAVAKIDDVRHTVTSEFKKNGDLVYLVGKTYDELGGSEFYQLFGQLGAHVPLFRKESAKRIYDKMIAANEQHLIASCHDISNGGMIIAVAESAMGGDIGVELRLHQDDLDLNAILFSESHSRFIVSIAPENARIFEALMGDDAQRIGRIQETRSLIIHWEGTEIIHLDINSLSQAWKNGLRF